MPHTPKHHQFLHILFTSLTRLNVHDEAYMETVYCMKTQKLSIFISLHIKVNLT